MTTLLQLQQYHSLYSEPVWDMKLQSTYYDTKYCETKNLIQWTVNYGPHYSTCMPNLQARRDMTISAHLPLIFTNTSFLQEPTYT